MKRKYTQKQILEYLDQLWLNIQNNQQAIYDLRDELGSLTQIPTRWSVFRKSIKDKYLKAKKSIAYEK